MLSRRKLFAAGALLALATSVGLPVQAATVDDPQAFIQNLGNKAMKVLGNTALSQDQRGHEVRQLLTVNFDLDRIGALALGRFGKQATEAEWREYRALFQDYIVMIYSTRIGDRSWNSFTVLGSRQSSDGDTIVASETTTKGEAPNRIDWRVHSVGGSLRIIDVAIAGISMVVTQREEFGSVIQRSDGGIAQLLQRLRQRTAQNK
jgi:phospholipid transport system substrate-binding protein